MDERTGTIIKDILEERQRLGDNLEDLGKKVREVTDWRIYFHRKPWILMGLAVGGGFLLSALLTPSRRVSATTENAVE